mmetsp:Transcript_11985/g.28429  ORF Transcript_11985/g.28429 Transcript_11985/m.28429 type:complete len:361 (+) Transcript_11985:149-1231(+)|eukprot:CAMPEP_0197185038 /NCGR_PEP_ID=MMETSP1423-20130617/11107_1 /TAXON_ID=476441 /ORGANISM="Pseudo-nitzschia heimii, Strain UNC1101" /LENGTH=360 /DNA_ID=CAMNT_0042636001 /DNA_START=46 /DNA_END=1128 /DNA_ORIENTATION=-
MRDKEKKIKWSPGFSCHNFWTRTADTAFPVIGGCVAFGTTLALSTAVQKVIGVSTATNLIPSLLGFGTVCAASLISEQAAILTYEMKKDPKKRKLEYIKKNLNNQISNAAEGVVESSSSFLRRRKKQNLKLPVHEIRVCLVGLLAFKSLGGRFWAISPSSFTHLGSFARWSIPCTENYANPKQRVMIEKMGRKWGCHTCGSHMYFLSAKSASTGKSYRFVGDHMPPKSVAKHMNDTWLRKIGLLRKVRYSFYPQCALCSSKQGSLLSKAGSNLHGLPSRLRVSSMKGAGGGRIAHFHGFRPRINHLAGGILAATIVVEASDEEIAHGNPKRLKDWQRRIEKVMQQIQGKYYSSISKEKTK